jgi:regulator of sigma E protease
MNKLIPAFLSVSIYLIAGLLFPQIVLTITVTVLMFGFLVFVHELGHFLAAVASGVYVEEFAFGFGPKIIGKKFKGTEYRINVIPLGGYVKMLGDEDPSSFKQSKEYKNNPRSYISKKWWQKLIIVSGGVFMNLLTAFVIFYIYLGISSFSPSPIRKISDYNFIGAEQSEHLAFVVEGDSPAQEAGVFDRGALLEINGEEVNTDIKEITNILEDYSNDTIQIKVADLLDGDIKEFELNLNSENVIDNNKKLGLYPISSRQLPRWDDDEDKELYYVRLEEDNLEEGETTPALSADLPSEGFIGEINGQDIDTRDELSNILNDNRGSTIDVEVINYNGDSSIYEVELPDEEEVRLGVFPISDETVSQMEPPELYLINYSNNKLLSGIFHTWNTIAYQAEGIAIFIGEAFQGRPEQLTNNLASPIRVGSAVGNIIGLDSYINIINLTGLISATLAFMNLLPIPLLDGGQLVIILIEKITGRPIPEKVQEWLGRFGFVFLIGLGVLVLLKDFWQDILTPLFRYLF